MDLTRDSCCQREIERNKKSNAIRKKLEEMDPVQKRIDVQSTAVGFSLSSLQDTRVNVSEEIENEIESSSDFSDEDSFFESYMAERMEEMNIKSVFTLISTEPELIKRLRSFELKENSCVVAIFTSSIQQDKLAESISSQISLQLTDLRQLKLSLDCKFNLSNWFIGYKDQSLSEKNTKPLLLCLKYSLGSLHVLSSICREACEKRKVQELIEEIRPLVESAESEKVGSQLHAEDQKDYQKFACGKKGCNKTFSHKHFLAKELNEEGYC